VGLSAPSDASAYRDGLERMAAAGGTDRAFVLKEGADLTRELQGTLNQIRGAALPCELKLPPAPSGARIDYGKVNLRFAGAAGAETVLYAGTPERCDPDNGGWYYDVEPAKGIPTSLVACPATCQRFKAEEEARVDLLVGCSTIVIP
jgi:hypothetical protein